MPERGKYLYWFGTAESKICKSPFVSLSASSYPHSPLLLIRILCDKLQWTCLKTYTGTAYLTGITTRRKQQHHRWRKSIPMLLPNIWYQKLTQRFWPAACGKLISLAADETFEPLAFIDMQKPKNSNSSNKTKNIKHPLTLERTLAKER